MHKLERARGFYMLVYRGYVGALVVTGGGWFWWKWALFMGLKYPDLSEKVGSLYTYYIIHYFLSVCIEVRILWLDIELYMLYM